MKMRHLRDRLRELLKLDEPPHRLALAFSVGVFVAFSPWLGLHIASAIFLAWVFRLNKVVVLTASLINNPWTVVPMYAFCLWFGIEITGGRGRVPPIDWRNLEFRDIFTVLRPYLLPYLVGTIVIGGLSAVAGYYLFLFAVRKYRKEEARIAEVLPTGPEK